MGSRYEKFVLDVMIAVLYLCAREDLHLSRDTSPLLSEVSCCGGGGGYENQASTGGGAGSTTLQRPPDHPRKNSPSAETCN
jgi:hypothetical protein